MKIFHGSKEIIEFPKILPSLTSSDFGTGFYTTPEYAQAVRWMHVAARNRTAGFISIFNFALQDALDVGLQIKTFTTPDEEFVRFVCKCHTDAYWEHGYDIVSGPLPDDRGYQDFTRFESGVFGEQELKKRLSKRDFSHQCLFHTTKALNLLKFVGFRRIRLTW